MTIKQATLLCRPHLHAARPVRSVLALMLAVQVAAGFADSITVVDGLDRRITIAAPAQRVVSLAPAATEIVFALGAGGVLVGRDDFSDFPQEALAVPSVGSLYPKVNLEVVLSLAPDLVLASGITAPEDVRAMTELGLLVYAGHNAAALHDIYADIEATGALLGAGAKDAAAALVADMRSRVAAVQQRTAQAARPMVFYEIDATDPAKPWTAGPGSFIDQLLTVAGADNLGRIGTQPYYQISAEELVARSPQVIILGSATYGGQTPELVRARAGWGAIDAVRAGAVYAFDDNLISRPGPRVADGLEQLARLIHPQLF